LDCGGPNIGKHCLARAPAPKRQKESDIVLHLLGVIIIGAIVGLIAKFLVPGRDPGGFIVTR
jgi:hypothetical protein